MKAEQPSPPDLRAFPGYRAFLRAYYEFHKERRSGYSYTTLSRKLGFRSRSYLQHVIAGKKNLGAEAIESFSALFPREPGKFEAFKAMVMRDQARTEKTRLQWELRLNALLKLPKATEMRKDDYVFYSDWYFVPMYFLPLLPGFREDARWIRERLLFPVPKPKIEAAIRKFRELGYWTNTPGDSATLLGPVGSVAELDRQKIRDFLLQSFEIGLKAIRQEPAQDSLVTAITLALTPEQFVEVRNLVLKFKQTELYQFNNQAPGRDYRIYHMLLGLSPLTKSGKR